MPFADATRFASMIFFIFCILGIHTSAFSFQGPGGSANDGEDGVVGDPGTNGENGEDGDDVEGGHFSFAQDGGNGGNGGNGIDQNGDGIAAGGNGGNGGHGGSAYSSANSRGGNGGHGGLFGRGVPLGLDGLGGSGGHGGDGHTYTMTPNGFSLRTAGGFGGDAYGEGASAGHGGNALARGVSSNSNAGSGQLIKFGGRGGRGLFGADGGNGASVTFGVEEEFQNSNGGYFATMRYFARAGKGGDSENGLAGAAGDLTVDMMGVKSQQGSNIGSSSFLDFDLFSGYGGRGLATGNQVVSGRHGGAVELTGSTSFEAVTRSALHLDIRSGNGGAAIGSKNMGTGGNGGVISVDPIHLAATASDSAGYTIFRANVIGGDGGHAQGSGRAGHGASVDLENAITMEAKYLGLNETTVRGGHGGWGRFNGNGGDANVSTSNSLLQQAEYRFDLNRFRLRAYGGNAGLGVAGQIAATGGDASVSSTEQTTNSLTIDVAARGGFGNLGKSGDANAFASATMTGASNGDSFGATAMALAESQRPLDFDRVLPSIGTTSVSEARAVSNSVGKASTWSRAVGGWGFLKSGSANSLAFSQNNAEGRSVSQSSSFSVGDRDPDSDNSSTSHAMSRSHEGEAEATSVAAGVGHFSRIHASSTIDAQEGTAFSRTLSSTRSWNHSAEINNTVEFESTSGQSAMIDSSSHFGFRQTDFANPDGVESRVDLLLIPDRDFADTMISPGITDVIDEDADVLGLGSIGGGFAGDPFEGELEINSAIDMSLRLQHFHDDKNLILGLFNAESTGNGFESMSFSATFQGLSIIDETFDSVDEANLFFDDNLFNLADLNNEELLVEFEFEVDMVIQDDADSFSFDFLFANALPRMMGPQNVFGSGGGLGAVPEPANGLFLTGLMIAASLRRRKQ